jgi:hypothetical protein
MGCICSFENNQNNITRYDSDMFDDKYPEDIGGEPSYNSSDGQESSNSSGNIM